jgi:hypothetical protein
VRPLPYALTVLGVHGLVNTNEQKDVDGRDKRGHDALGDYKSGLGAATLGPVTFIIQQ